MLSTLRRFLALPAPGPGRLPAALRAAALALAAWAACGPARADSRLDPDPMTVTLRGGLAQRVADGTVRHLRVGHYQGPDGREVDILRDVLAVRNTLSSSR